MYVWSGERGLLAENSGLTKLNFQEKKEKGSRISECIHIWLHSGLRLRLRLRFAIGLVRINDTVVHFDVALQLFRTSNRLGLVEYIKCNNTCIACCCDQGVHSLRCMCCPCFDVLMVIRHSSFGGKRRECLRLSDFIDACIHGIERVKKKKDYRSLLRLDFRDAHAVNERRGRHSEQKKNKLLQRLRRLRTLPRTAAFIYPILPNSPIEALTYGRCPHLQIFRSIVVSM